MTYNIIFFGKQTKVIDSVYLFVSQHYTQILHKQLVKDRLLDALLMIYNKSIYTLRYSGIEAHLKHHTQLCKSCDRKISARRPETPNGRGFACKRNRDQVLFLANRHCSETDCINTVVAISQAVLIQIL